MEKIILTIFGIMGAVISAVAVVAIIIMLVTAQQQGKIELLGALGIGLLVVAVILTILPLARGK